MASINKLPIQSKSWVTLPLSTLNKGVCLKRTGNYFLQLINFQFLFLPQFFFITSPLWTWITEWRNQPTSRLYGLTSFISSRYLYQGTIYTYKGDTYFSSSILQKWPWPKKKKKIEKAHVLHSDLYKKLRTLQLWNAINAGIYNWESRTEELCIGI